VITRKVALPDSNDLRLLAFMRDCSPPTPIILMTAYGTPGIVQDALRLGAYILDKPFEVKDLVPLIEHTLAFRPS
jgi:DNA-binding NtrC family response regulator